MSCNSAVVNFQNSDALKALISSELKVAMSVVFAGRVGLSAAKALALLTELIEVAIFFAHGVNLTPSKQ